MDQCVGIARLTETVAPLQINNKYKTVYIGTIPLMLHGKFLSEGYMYGPQNRAIKKLL
jgi:hypothetical protein